MTFQPVQDRCRWTSVNRVLFTLVAACVTACTGTTPPSEVPAVATDRPIAQFSYQTIDGQPLSTASVANRLTVIGFLTTYDIPAQVQARILTSLLNHHTPRINVAAIMLEEPKAKPMVEAFTRSLALPYPVAIVEATTLASQPPFEDMVRVPSVVVLDRNGRVAFRHIGLIGEAALDAVLRKLDAAP